MTEFRILLSLIVMAVMVALPDEGRAGESETLQVGTPVPRSILNQPGRELRVAWPGNRAQGTFERFAADTLWLRANTDSASVPVGGGLVGAAGGALLGAVVGLPFSRWKQRWPPR